MLDSRFYILYSLDDIEKKIGAGTGGFSTGYVVLSRQSILEIDCVLSSKYYNGRDSYKGYRAALFSCSFSLLMNWNSLYHSRNAVASNIMAKYGWKEGQGTYFV